MEHVSSFKYSLFGGVSMLNFRGVDDKGGDDDDVRHGLWSPEV